MSKLKKELLILAVISSVIVNSLPVQATKISRRTSTIKRNIGNFNRQLHNNQKDQKNLEGSRNQLRKEAAKLVNDIEQTQKDIDRAVQEIANKQKIVNSYTDKIKNHEQTIKNYKTEIDKINATMEESKNKVRNYLVKMYKNDKDKRELKLLLEAQSFSDIMKASKYINEYNKLAKNVRNACLGQINRVNNLKRVTSTEMDSLNQSKLAIDKELEKIKKKESEINAKRENQQANLRIITKSIQDNEIRAEALARINKSIEQSRNKLQETLDGLSGIEDENIPARDGSKPIDAGAAPAPALPSDLLNGQFIYPLHPSIGYVSSGFGGIRHHKGVDIVAPFGTPIYAVADGIVIYAGSSAYGKGHGGYGNVVDVDHSNGLCTRYAHMTRTAVKAGQRVKKGQLIGYVGNTTQPNTTRGSGTPHLHFEIINKGVKVNPQNYINFPRTRTRSKSQNLPPTPPANTRTRSKSQTSTKKSAPSTNNSAKQINNKNIKNSVKNNIHTVRT